MVSLEQQSLQIQTATDRIGATVHTCGVHYLEYNNTFRHCHEGSLKLLEVSLDINLARNALELEVEGSAELIPDVCVHESEDESMVIVMFATTSAVYRLVLHHPELVMKVGSLQSGVEGRWGLILVERFCFRVRS